jgi:cytochrome c biogenesis protein CcmG, thiol:disulfide interchange protein DsbE
VGDLERENNEVTAQQPIARRISIAIGVVTALLLGVLIIAFTRDTQDAQSPLLARPAPEITSTTLDGDPFVLSRRKGSWVVLNFFNSTCVPCKREHPELVKFAEGQEELGTGGAELYTIVNDDSDEAVRAFFDEFGGEWPIVRDDDARIAVDYGIAKVPETWLISPTGVVAQRFTGQVTAELLGTAIASMGGSR